MKKNVLLEIYFLMIYLKTIIQHDMMCVCQAFRAKYIQF